jgi:hypothetical protein
MNSTVWAVGQYIMENFWNDGYSAKVSYFLGGFFRFPWTDQRYTLYRVLQTIQIKLIFLFVWAEPAILDSAKTALKFKYEI